jgi:hydroxymethylbilane synthase
VTETTLRLGTRGSTLARWQSASVARALAEAVPSVRIEEVIITSRGDSDQVTPLPAMGGAGAFTDALEEALLRKEIDIAVHSLKDVPVLARDGLCLPAIRQRDDARDALLSTRGWTLETLPRNSVVGSCSTRRTAQLLAARPDLQVAPLRGNVETRIRRLEEGKFDAIVLAMAGVTRLGLTQWVSEVWEPTRFLPAPGQGALGVQCRAGDAATRGLVGRINELQVQQSTDCERAFLLGLGGGCAAPVAAFARIEDGVLTLDGCVSAVDGRGRIRLRGVGVPESAAALGHTLAAEARSRGAEEYLA